MHKELAELRSKIVPLSLLQWSDCGTLAVGSGATVAAAPSAIVAAGPSPSPPPAESEKEWRQQTALLLAFAMGTHARLGEGYASRDGPCAVRLVARNEDVIEVTPTCSACARADAAEQLQSFVDGLRKSFGSGSTKL